MWIFRVFGGVEGGFYEPAKLGTLVMGLSVSRSRNAGNSCAEARGVRLFYFVAGFGVA
jgi:hypothetical protein